ncbi:DUF4215 domain-containing protein [Vulgatibacter sp.]|uniref:DUF4215 domain-containing protein n=1 Tax=Vulgatibacter sp. TaxID=1971226 RepID=UPI003561EBD3
MTKYLATGLLACVALTATACGSEEDPVCGNGAVESGETCDDGNNNDNDGCTNACEPARCGDGIVEDGEEACDDGNADNSDGCLNTCEVAVCGDGFVHEGVEGCDDGNDDDTDACLSTCVLASCGDGVVQEGEACDDGNDDETDGCLSTCLEARCGDGFVQAGVEDCDDGNTSDNDACLNSCELNVCGDGKVNDGVEDCDDGNTNQNDACLNSCEAPSCGDGFIQVGVEDCDDGAANSDTTPGACRTTCEMASCGDGTIDPNETCDDGAANSDTEPGACRTNCALATCGDGVIDEGEACDDGAANSNGTPDACRTTCTLPTCGDAVKDSGEACDDGNENQNDGCLAGCVAATCGDGIIRIGVEECDDGAANSDETPGACRTDCHVAFCGDGVTDPGEECDDGTNAGGAADVCRPGCVAATCGDGVLDTGEACDDGNLERGDGCGLTCEIECGNGIVDPGESCDDGNTVGGDGCGATCVVEPIVIGDVFTPEIRQGSLDTTDPTHRRARWWSNACQDFGNITHYDLYEIHNPHAEAKAITMQATWSSTGDGYFVLYRGPFDPSNPAVGCFASNGAGNTSYETKLAGIVINPNETLTLIATQFSDRDGYGPYTLTVSVDNVCGDSFLGEGETCDDGDAIAGDGCSDSCQLETGYVCRTPGQPCTVSVCGDSVKEGTEVCDDGNAIAGDGCSADCQQVETGYVCDTPDGQLCRAVVCGDQIVDAGYEECDDGNAIAGDGCFACEFEGNTCNAPWVVQPAAGQLTFEWNNLTTEQFTGEYEATCRETKGNDAVIAFTSPVAARWRFEVVAARASATMALSVRTDCVDVATEQACIQDTNPRTVWLDYDLDANETVYLIADQFATSSYLYHTDFLVRGTGIPVLGLGEACDPTYATNRCVAGSSCQGATLPVCTAAICGDTVVDYVAGETCDDGNLVAGDGCDSCAMEGDSCADAFPMSAAEVRTGVWTWSADQRWFDNDVTATACTTSTNTATGRLRDAVAQFTAPTAGEYTFYLDTPDHNGLMLVEAGACGSTTSQTCVSAQSAGKRESHTRTLAAGETVTITVDATAAANEIARPAPVEGPFTLTIAEVACGNGVVQAGESCDDGNLIDGDGCSSTCVAQGDDCSYPFDLNAIDTDTANALLWTHTGSTMGMSADYAGSCEASARPEVVYAFTAPQAGRYQFRESIGTSFNATLYIWDSCPLSGTGMELICSGSGSTDTIQYDLTANQTVYLVLDQYGTASTVTGTGDYALEVTLVPSP